jgi:hypothetical protein
MEIGEGEEKALILPFFSFSPLKFFFFLIFPFSWGCTLWV